MMYLTLQCFGTSLGIAIATSMLLAQVGADKLPYIFVGISFAVFVCFDISAINGSKGSQYICRLYMAVGFIVILGCNLMIRADLYLAGINLVYFCNISHFCTFGLGHHAFWKLLSNCAQPVTAKKTLWRNIIGDKIGRNSRWCC